MESLSLISLTFASALFATPMTEADKLDTAITRHTSPAMAGLWEIDLTQDEELTPQKIKELKHWLEKNEEQQLLGNNVDVGMVDLTAGISNQQDLETADITVTKEITHLENQEAAIEQLVDKDLVTNKQINNKQISEELTNEGLLASDITVQKNCKERYNFGADNEVWTVSGKEWTYGQYAVSQMPEGLPILAIQTFYDNNEVDCANQKIDQSGETILAFLDYQPESEQMHWCLDKQGKQCFVHFKKVLP